MFSRKKKGDLTAKNIEAGGNVTIENKGGEGNIHAEKVTAGRDVLIVKGALTYIEQRKPDTPAISLDEALSILAAMPVSEDVPIPKVTTLSIGSQMPFAPYPYFVGREPELRQLATILKAEQGRAAIGQLVATTGLGGIGKTQLAVEFAHRYGQYFAGGLFWLDFSNAEGINNEVARCGGIDGMNLLDGFENLPLPDQVRLVQRAWQKPLPRLLIFDNCEDEVLVDEWRPKTGGCRVLITSRRGEWDVARAIHQIRLDTLTPAESLRLFGHLAPRLTTKEKMSIAEALGHFPLALHLAGSFLNRYKKVVANRYLAEIEQKTLHHTSLEGRGSTYSPTQHELHVARTFAISWERLNKSNPIDHLAQQLFLHAAYFAPGIPIPPDLWRLTLTEQDTEPPTLTEYDYEDAQFRLLELGLLEEEPTGFVIHRLLAAFAHIQPMPQPQQAVENAILKETDYLLNADYGYPAHLLSWQAHLRHITNVALPREDILAANLCHSLGQRLYIVADYEKANFYAQHAYTIRQKILEPDHLDIAASLSLLGILWQAMGEYEKALPCLQRAVTIHKKGLNIEYTNITRSLNSLGLLLQAMGEHEKARTYYEEAFAISEEMLGPEHHDTAVSLNNLGYLCQATGEYDKGHHYTERSLAINKEVLGFEHHHIATNLNNLGVLFRMTGEYKKALPYYEQAYAIWEKVLGTEHPLTATSLNNLGILWQVMGHYEEALPYYERALAIREKVLGTEHPKMARILNNIGTLLMSTGEYKKALPYFERSLAIWEEALGPEHPNIAQTLNNLGALWQAMKKYEKARPYHERAFNIREKALGIEHPDTAQSLHNLGFLWQAMKEYERAQLYMQRALAVNEKVLGAEHPNTAQSLNNLGRLWQAMGQYERAYADIEHALVILKKTLGMDHPTTAVVMGNLGRVLCHLGSKTEGRAHLQQAVTTLEKQLGKDHPKTEQMLGYLRELDADEGE